MRATSVKSFRIAYEPTVSAKSPIQKYSAGPNFSAIVASGGLRKMSATQQTRAS
jgi:hypothetical protein